jgi:CheY-like chemotaxis protein
VILGYAELALDKVARDDPLHTDLTEIVTAARRSADITRQLLAFARRQTIAPKVLDLNDTVEGMLRMLRRIIGEDIDLQWLPQGSLWPVKIDPGQVDQLLANLCVNARDAIDGTGKITIETDNVNFDRQYCRDHLGFITGDYVLLAVSDDGSGMGAEIREHLFEPFFTTKEAGQGTGLGLATVYGIVKQNNGFINVYSEPGAGTTFKIYLPRHAEAIAPLPVALQEKIDAGHGETILVVEDEAAVLKLSCAILEGLGYRVMAATGPAEAEKIAGKHDGPIDLLITDVVMPQMNGRELATRLQTLSPNLRVLYMSGYTANVIAHHGVLEGGVYFIQKPFSRQEFAAQVREALG